MSARPKTEALSSPEIDAITIQGAVAPVKSKTPKPTTKGDIDD